MKDEGITAVGERLADKAVNYLLRRIQVDANLRWYMLGTQAFAMLCEAEAARTGVTVEVVKKQFSAPANGDQAYVHRVEDTVAGVRDFLKDDGQDIDRRTKERLLELLEPISY